MKTMLQVLTIILLVSSASAEQGYKRDPWGSSKWTGSGTPPHFQNQPTPSTEDRESDLTTQQNPYRRHHNPRGYRVDTAIVKMCEGFDEIFVLVNGRQIPYEKGYVFNRLDKCPGTFTKKTSSDGDVIVIFIPQGKSCY